MTTEKTVTLTADECAALYHFVDVALNDANEVFAWDGSDDPADDTVRALAKVFLGAGEEVPLALAGVLGEPSAPPRLAEVPDRPPGHVDAVAEVKSYPVPVNRWPDGEAVLLLRSATGRAAPILAAEVVDVRQECVRLARVQTSGAVYFVREPAADIRATLDRLKAERGGGE